MGGRGVVKERGRGKKTCNVEEVPILECPSEIQ